MKLYTVSKFRIFLLPSVISIFEIFIQNKPKDNEAGGILFGQIQGNNIYILKASIPNKFDRASRYNFERDPAIAQILVNHEFLNSERRTIYLGEWHTHPEDYPTPSTPDRVMIRTQFQKNLLNEDFLILIIQGLKGLYIGFYNGKELVVASEIKL